MPDSQNEKKYLCAGNGCSNTGIYPLTIVFLNRTGWFCRDCRDKVVASELALPASKIESLLIGSHNDHHS